MERQHIQNAKLASIDIVKGIAICMVILVHSRHRIIGISSAFNIFMFGQMAVQLFFVVSAFGLSGSWEKIAESGEKHPYLCFLKRRFKALAPGWYVMFFVVYMLNTAAYKVFNCDIGFGEDRRISSIVCNLLFLNGLFPEYNNTAFLGAWYIGTTAVFYAVFPLLYSLFKKVGKIRRYVPYFFEIILLMTIVVLDKCFDIFFLYNNTFAYYSMPNQLPCFTLGIALWFVYKEGNVLKWRRLTGTIGIAILLYCIDLFWADVRYRWAFMPFLVGIGTCFILKALLDKERTVGLQSWLGRLFGRLGQNSYYMYLVHGLFCYSMPKFIIKILESVIPDYNPTVLYLILLPLMFVFTYFGSLGLKKICQLIIKKK